MGSGTVKTFSQVTSDIAAALATAIARGNHTGTQSADSLVDGTTNKAFLATERTKLTGVATGATANSTDASLLASAALASTQVVLNTQTASYTLVLTDAGKVIEMNVAGANTLTVPLNSAVAYPVGTVIEIYNMGAGVTTVTATGGVTLRSVASKVALSAQYAVASIRKRATDEWVLTGSLA